MTEMAETDRAGAPLSTWIARGGIVVFALMLWVSALLKGESPWNAAAALQWTGLELATLRNLVDLLSVLEALVGGLLLFALTLRPLLYFGALFAAALLVGHVLGMITSSAAHCGCFGAVPVPDWAVIAGVAVGLLGCLWAARRPAPTPRWLLPRAAVAILVGALALLPMLGRAAPSQTPPAEELLRELEISKDGEDALILVGSVSCPHCCESLRELEQARRERPELEYVAFYFVTRPKDEATPLCRLPAWAQERTIPPELWWRLIKRAPPSFVRVNPDLPLEIAESWKQMRF